MYSGLMQPCHHVSVSNLIMVSKRSIRAPSSRPLRMPPFPTTTQRRQFSDLFPGWDAESESGSFKEEFTQNYQVFAHLSQVLYLREV